MLSTGTTSPDLQSLPVRTLISFRSKNANDTTLWTGALLSRGVYESYPGIGSQMAYNEAVRQSDPTVSSDYTSLNYFMIKFTNNATTKTGVFAVEWIADGSLTVISQSTVQTVVVDDPYDDPNRLLNLIRSGGYQAKLSS